MYKPISLSYSWISGLYISIKHLNCTAIKLLSNGILFELVYYDRLLIEMDVKLLKNIYSDLNFINFKCNH